MQVTLRDKSELAVGKVAEKNGFAALIAGLGLMCERKAQTMARTAKTLLTLSITCLILGGAINTGVINPRGVDALYVVLPFGAVFFGLFLIVLVLEKESDVSTEDRQLNEPVTQGSAKHAPPKPSP